MPGIIAILGGIGGIRHPTLAAISSCCIACPDIATSAPRDASRNMPGDAGVVKSRCISSRALGDVPRRTRRPVRRTTPGERSALISTRNWT
jgi:hypothetical protein